MPNRPEFLSRRECLKRGLASLVVIPVGLAVTNSSAVAAERLTESDPVAKGLGYVHDATKADTEKFPKGKGAAGKTQLCSNCQFFQGKANAEWAPCLLFQLKEVNAAGWCNGWVQKPK